MMFLGRSEDKVKSAKFRTLSDFRSQRRETDRQIAGVGNTTNQLLRLGLEGPELSLEMLRDGADLLRLLVFAAADAVVVCEAHDSEESAWVRLGIAMALAFAPTGKLVYAVDRSLVHIPAHKKSGLNVVQMPTTMTKTAAKMA